MFFYIFLCKKLLCHQLAVAQTTNVHKHLQFKCSEACPAPGNRFRGNTKKPAGKQECCALVRQTLAVVDLLQLQWLRCRNHIYNMNVAGEQSVRGYRCCRQRDRKVQQQQPAESFVCNSRIPVVIIALTAVFVVVQ